MRTASRANPAATPGPIHGERESFERFVRETGPQLGRAFAASYGFEDGRDATAEALAYACERQRLAVVLVHGYGYTLREVAELTGIKPTTVQNHLTRGLSRLRALLGADYED
jgi:DNA-directed RNA polymerase specialized sigma24 family protein